MNHRTTHPRIIRVVMAVALVLTACGSAPVSVAVPGAQNPPEPAASPAPAQPAADQSTPDRPAPPVRQESPARQEPPVQQEPPEPGGAGAAGPDDSGWQRVAGRDDLISLQPGVIDHVVLGQDGKTLLVRYIGAAEPCSGAKAIAIESATEVVVSLEVGLDPNAAAMSCIAMVVNYEIAVGLNAPVGDRKIVYADVSPGSGAPGGSVPGGDVAVDMSRFQGLTFDQAVELAESEGRPWRVTREDDEIFAVTMDYSVDRVNFEVDDGVVTRATAG